MRNSLTRETLEKEIWRACDILRRDNNCGGIMEYVEHLSWLLFLRFLDAQEEELEAQAELGKRDYHPIIEQPYRWRDWAKGDLPADKLLNFIHGKLIPYLQGLGGDPLRDTIRSVFAERNVVVCASGYNLKDVISIINEINFHNQDDIFTVSNVYESLLFRMGQENDSAGEFYTPRPVIRFIVEVINPRIGETVYDPACGTCGFLVQAYLWMKEQEKTLEDHLTLQENTFFGQEKKPIPALLGVMNLVLHGVSAPKVFRRNTLEENIRQVNECYDVIITNPPFGGTEGKHIQQNFPIRSNSTELLFIQHIMRKLKRKNGARCGMVVPEGTLFRNSSAFVQVKRELLEQFNLHTIVSLPPGTFAPYSDVKTALIFFERPGPTTKIWYYELPLPEGLKKFSKGNPILDEHFQQARRLWHEWDKYRKSSGDRESCLSENSWITEITEIIDKEYDLSAKNPHRKEVLVLPSPMEILSTLIEKQREIQEILNDLDELITNSKNEIEKRANGIPEK